MITYSFVFWLYQMASVLPLHPFSSNVSTDLFFEEDDTSLKEDIDLLKTTKLLVGTSYADNVLVLHKKDLKKLILALRKPDKKDSISYRYYLSAAVGIIVLYKVISAMNWYISFLESLSNQMPECCKGWPNWTSDMLASIKDCFAYNPFDFFNIEGKYNSLSDLCDKQNKDLSAQQASGIREYHAALEKNSSETLSAVKKQQKELKDLQKKLCKQFENELSMVTVDLYKKLEKHEKKSEQSLQSNLKSHQEAEKLQSEQASEQLKKYQEVITSKCDNLLDKQQKAENMFEEKADDLSQKVMSSLQKQAQDQLDEMKLFQNRVEKKVDSSLDTSEQKLSKKVSDRLNQNQKELIASMTSEMQKNSQELQGGINAINQQMKSQLEERLQKQTDSLSDCLNQEIKEQLQNHKDSSEQVISEKLLKHMTQYEQGAKKVMEELASQYQVTNAKGEEKIDMQQSKMINNLTDQTKKTTEKILQEMRDEFAQHKSDQSSFFQKYIKDALNSNSKEFEEKYNDFKDDLVKQSKGVEKLKSQLLSTDAEGKESQKDLLFQYKVIIDNQKKLENKQKNLEKTIFSLKKNEKKVGAKKECIAQPPSHQNPEEEESIDSSYLQSIGNYSYQALAATYDSVRPSKKGMKMVKNEVRKLL